MRSIYVVIGGCMVAASTAFGNVLPVAGHFCLPDVEGCVAPQLMDWSADSEAAQYYKKTTPIAKRIKLNQHAGDMVPQFGFDDSNTAAQFEFGHWVPQETNWQYLQQMVYFGGSQSGGQVIAPTPGWIRAAHQNGVKISGTIFFSPWVYGGDKEIKAFNELITPGAQQTAIARQLASLAKTYGFDGWFINQEVAGMDAKSMKGMQSFIHQLHLANPDLIVTWYDDSDTWTFLQDGMHDILFDPFSDQTITNPVFINYGWGDAKQYADEAKRIGYPISNIQYGVEVPAGGMNGWAAQQSYFNRVMPNANTAYGALVEWDYMTMITHTSDGKVVDQSLNQLNDNERNMWTNGADQGQDGASQVVPWFGAVTQKPFATFFNTGEGSDYYIDGQAQMVGKWHDIGQQDLLPTWQFNINSSHSNGVSAKLEYAYDKAYQGASSLHLQTAAALKNGELTVPLYKSALTIADGDVLKVASQNAGDAKVCLHTGSDLQCYQLGASTFGQWHQDTFALKAISGKAVSQIDWVVEGSDKASGSDWYLGQLYLGAKQIARNVAVDVHTEAQCHPSVDCVSWSAVANAVNYRVFNAQNQFVGATHQLVFTVPNASGSEQSYHVQALAADGSVL